jgi:cytidylate kinase
MVVAIDGPAGAGKSTVARAVADGLGFTYLDSGAMYRCVGLAARRRGRSAAEVAPELDIRLGERVLLDGEDVTDEIRTPRAARDASRVAADPAVRRAMVAKQREIGERTSVVMEGRDIGTVVFPNAQVKIFLDANPDERVRRRCEEMRAKGETVNTRQLAAQMKERDQRDSTRADAPLAQAPDAVYLDSTTLGIEEVIESILKIVRSRLTNGKEYR